MRGFIEHNGADCLLGEHSNRGTITDMCPVFLELRRERIRRSMRDLRYAKLVAADAAERDAYARAVSR